MNFNYPQFILIFFFNIYTNIFIFAHIYLPIVRISILCREIDAIANHHRVTIETFEGSLENLIRHRLRSFPLLLPGKNSHRRRENKFHAPRNRKQGGADRENTFFHPQFLSRRPGEGRGRQIQIARQTWSNTER